MDFHGYANVRETKSRGGRLFWSLVVLAATGGCLTLSFLTVARYFERQTITSAQLISALRRGAPEVKVCGNWPSLDIDSLRDSNLSEAAVSSLGIMVGSVYRYVFESDSEEIFQQVAKSKSVNAELLRYLGSEKDWVQVLMKNTVKCRALLGNCSLGHYDFDCCADGHVINVIDPLHGKCFVLRRFDGLYNIAMASFRGGRRFSVFPLASSVRQQVYLDFVETFYTPSFAAILVGMQQTSHVALKIVEHIRVEPNCQNKFLNLRSVGEHCRVLVSDAIVNNVCNCSCYWPNADAMRLCTPYMLDDCASRYPEKIAVSAMDSEVERQCEKPPCHEWLYEVASLSSAPNEDGDPAANVFVYFSSLSHSQYTESQAFTFDSVVSSVGGNMGLFIGASVVTLVQVWAYICLTAKKWLGRVVTRKSADGESTEAYNVSGVLAKVSVLPCSSFTKVRRLSS